MRSAEHQSTAQIIQFPVSAARKARSGMQDARIVPARQAGGVPILWGNAWYHDDAIASDAGEMHS